MIYHRLKDDSCALVWLKNWGVWQSSGHVHLLLRLRQALGENRSLDETPGHLFSANESDDAVSVLILSLEFYWDCLLVGSALNFACGVSHDEYYSIMGKDDSIMLEIENKLASGKWGAAVKQSE